MDEEKVIEIAQALANANNVVIKHIVAALVGSGSLNAIVAGKALKAGALEMIDVTENASIRYALQNAAESLYETAEQIARAT